MNALWFLIGLCVGSGVTMWVCALIWNQWVGKGFKAVDQERRKINNGQG